jgi:hypothetical protein
VPQVWLLNLVTVPELSILRKNCTVGLLKSAARRHSVEEARDRREGSSDYFFPYAAVYSASLRFENSSGAEQSEAA